jgi:hypothetical protein
MECPVSFSDARASLYICNAQIEAARRRASCVSSTQHPVIALAWSCFVPLDNLLHVHEKTDLVCELDGTLTVLLFSANETKQTTGGN